MYVEKWCLTQINHKIPIGILLFDCTAERYEKKC